MDYSIQQSEVSLMTQIKKTKFCLLDKVSEGKKKHFSLFVLWLFTILSTRTDKKNAFRLTELIKEAVLLECVNRNHKFTSGSALESSQKFRNFFFSSPSFHIISFFSRFYFDTHDYCLVARRNETISSINKLRNNWAESLKAIKVEAPDCAEVK